MNSLLSLYHSLFMNRNCLRSYGILILVIFYNRVLNDTVIFKSILKAPWSGASFLPAELMMFT